MGGFSVLRPFTAIPVMRLVICERFMWKMKRRRKMMHGLEQIIEANKNAEKFEREVKPGILDPGAWMLLTIVERLKLNERIQEKRKIDALLFGILEKKLPHISNKEDKFGWYLLGIVLGMKFMPKKRIANRS